MNVANTITQATMSGFLFSAHRHKMENKQVLFPRSQDLVPHVSCLGVLAPISSFACPKEQNYWIGLIYHQQDTRYYRMKVIFWAHPVYVNTRHAKIVV